MLPWACQAAQSKDGGGVQGDDSGVQGDAGGAASMNGKDAEASGPPTPQLDDLFREGAAWSEGRLPEVCKRRLTAVEFGEHLD